MLIGKVVEKSTKDLKTEVGIDDPDGFYFGDVHSDQLGSEQIVARYVLGYCEILVYYCTMSSGVPTVGEFKGCLFLEKKIVLLNILQLFIPFYKTQHLYLLRRSQQFIAHQHRDLVFELTVSRNAVVLVPAHELVEHGSELADGGVVVAAAFGFVVLRAEMLQSGAKFVVKQILDYHLAGYGLFELGRSGLLDDFVQIFVLESHPHFFLLQVFLHIVLLPTLSQPYLRVCIRMSLLMATFFMNYPKEPQSGLMCSSICGFLMFLLTVQICITECSPLSLRLSLSDQIRLSTGMCAMPSCAGLLSIYRKYKYNIRYIQQGRLSVIHCNQTQPNTYRSRTLNHWPSFYVKSLITGLPNLIPPSSRLDIPLKDRVRSSVQSRQSSLDLNLQMRMNPLASGPTFCMMTLSVYSLTQNSLLTSMLQHQFALRVQVLPSSGQVNSLVRLFGLASIFITSLFVNCTLSSWMDSFSSATTFSFFGSGLTGAVLLLRSLASDCSFFSLPFFYTLLGILFSNWGTIDTLYLSLHPSSVSPLIPSSTRMSRCGFSLKLPNIFLPSPSFWYLFFLGLFSLQVGSDCSSSLASLDCSSGLSCSFFRCLFIAFLALRLFSFSYLISYHSSSPSSYLPLLLCL